MKIQRYGKKFKKKLVISAINFTEGGPLTVLKDFINAASECLMNEWDIVVLVSSKDLFNNQNVSYLTFPLSKRSWFIRLYYEWFAFRRLSGVLKPDLWLSFHDITPNVISRRQSVYCHNPAPFYDVGLKEGLLDPALYLFSKLYSYIYKFNIKKNFHIVVQQDWIRNEFKRRYDVENVVVAHPVTFDDACVRTVSSHVPVVFIYPALPRIFKNFEVICAAAEILTKQGLTGFEIRITIDGKENRYATKIVNQYSKLAALKFIGRQTKSEMNEQYLSSDCLIFSSKLETWGLPISEAKRYHLPMLISNLPYAVEAVGDYDLVKFFPFNDPNSLANNLRSFIDGKLHFERVTAQSIKKPYANNWTSLVKILTKGL